MKGYLSNDFGILQNIISLAQRPDAEAHLVDSARVIIPINVSSFSTFWCIFVQTTQWLLFSSSVRDVESDDGEQALGENCGAVRR
jgi:hypothetical protein